MSYEPARDESREEVTMYEGITIEEFVLRLKQLVREARASGIGGEELYECGKDILAVSPEFWSAD